MKQKIFFLLLIIVSFITCIEKEDSAPKGFVEIDNIVINDALYTEITCDVKANGTIETVLFEYSLDPNFRTYEQTEGEPLQDKYSGILTALQENSTYYVRCRVQNKYSSCVSNLQSFKTKPFTTPKVRTDSASNITLHSATLYGTLEHRGTNVFPEVGFCFAKHKEVTIDDSCIIGSIDNQGHYHIDLTELEKNVFYYFRAYATNSVGTSYGEEMEAYTCDKPTVITLAVTNISYASATCGGNVTDDGGTDVTERGICYSTSQNPTIADNKVKSGIGVGSFTCNLTKLNAGTTYYARAYATNSKGTSYGEELTFTTKVFGKPTVTTSTVTDISYESATCGGNVTDDGGTDIIERGICYSTSKNPTISNNKVTSGSGLGSFSCNLTKLNAGTTYYVRAYATSSNGTSYGEEVSFATKAFTTPTVITVEITDIYYESATCVGDVTNDGGKEITECGICYSTSKNPTISNNKVTSSNGLGTFTCNLTNLTAGITYYIRAYAKNYKGISYGEELTFTTKIYGMPTVTTNEVTSITYESAICGGNVTDDAGSNVTERGICYSTSKNPTIADNKVMSGSGTGPFTCNLTNLTDGTTYYVRAYATNSKGTSYGTSRTFSTKAYKLPTVTTSDITDITDKSATCGGDVTDDGELEVTERGICYSTSPNPTITNKKVTSGKGTGSFSCNLTNLTEGTIYYVRAYATNKKGTSYGEEKTFTTKIYKSPTVITSAVIDSSYESAICGGNVTDDGGKEVIERGICYSTSQNPTILNNKVTSGSGVGSFSCILTNLTDGRNYYFRAYATNSIGTSYGANKTFNTKKYKSPTITTATVTDISYTSATCGGNITDDGGKEVTERGICYSTSNNPTIADNKVVNGSSGTGSFSCNLTKLTEGTIYYVRAYATNSKGTSYGEEKTFTTKAYKLPTVTTSDITDISYTSATCGGNITDDGGKEVTERGICYSTSNNPTIADNKVVNGSSGTGSFSCNLTNLTDGTTYYVRAYATNSKGTSYGEEKTFVTTIHPNRVIYYTASEKLQETTDYNSSGLHTNSYSFGSASIISHEFTNGQGKIVFDRELTTIGSFAFRDCSSLTSVTIPNSVTSIEQFAFKGCSRLSSIDIPNSVTSIGGSAFSGCSSLTSIDIPNSVTNIRQSAFSGCSSLTSITIPNSVTSIEQSAFSGCSSLTSITIPNSVTRIEQFAFKGCSRLSSIDIPNSVTSIGKEVFYNCSNLTSATIGNSVTSIGQGTFYNCSRLTSIDIPNSVTSIEAEAFYNCSRLTSVTIGNSVTSIGNWAFQFCSSLTSITIPNSVTSIWHGAFRDCSSLTSVTIGNSVTIIGSSAFSGCSNLSSIDIPNSVTSIGSSAFSGCSSLTSITIPNGVTSIEFGAFNNCSSLTSIDIPNSVTSIGYSAFGNCSSLTSVTIGNSVTSIGKRAFMDCSSLTSITIPNSVTSIGDMAFFKCISLTSIRCEAVTPPICDTNEQLQETDAFLYVSKTIPVYVPAESVDLYKEAEGWKRFTNIQAISE